MDTGLRRASDELRQLQSRRRRRERLITDTVNVHIYTGLRGLLSLSAALLKRFGSGGLDCTGKRALYLSFGLETSLFQQITGEITVDLSGFEIIESKLDRRVVQVLTNGIYGFTSKKMKDKIGVGLEKEVNWLGVALVGGKRKIKIKLVRDQVWMAGVKRVTLE